MACKPRREAYFCAAAALLLSAAATAQVRLGIEFQVNSYTNNHQSFPSIAVDADGDFVVVWQSILNQDGESYGIFGRRFSSAGVALASEFQVNTYTTNVQRLPSVAADADGNFVVAWQSLQDGFADGVFAQRFSSAGAALAIEFQVNAYTLFHQNTPSVAADADGDFVVAWSSNYEDGSNWGVFARRFSSTGAAVTSDFQVNSYTGSSQRYPSVSADVDGDFVIAWQSNLQDGSNYGVFARRFSSAGAPLTSEFQVNTYTTNYQRGAAVRMNADGDFLVAWHSSTQDGSFYGVFGQRFSSTGAALASEFQVNTYTTNSQKYPSVAVDGGGAFVVAWNSVNQDGLSYGVFGRRFSSAGAPLTSEFQVNTYTTSYQRFPSVGAEADGRFVVAWASSSLDGSAEGIFAQRFALTAVLDIDGNGSLDPLTDGLLLLRSLFGFTGSVLISGAVGGGCTRCDAAAIEPYIAGLGSTVDIDGTGNLGALTDGLLVLRYLFGFTGATLTNNAVGGGCTRCDANAIEPYLATLIS